MSRSKHWTIILVSDTKHNFSATFMRRTICGQMFNVQQFYIMTVVHKLYAVMLLQRNGDMTIDCLCKSHRTYILIA